MRKFSPQITYFYDGNGRRVKTQAPDGTTTTFVYDAMGNLVPSTNPAWYPGFNVCNSTTAIGLQFRCSEIVSGPVVAASNGTPWYKNSCITNALGAGARVRRRLR
jgi:YD repeat-containing protein